MTVVILIKFTLMLIHGITFILYVSNQSDLIHRDSGIKLQLTNFYGHNSKLILGGNWL